MNNGSFDHHKINGRGAAENPANRFENIVYTRNAEDESEEFDRLPATEFLNDTSRSILVKNDSPDLPFQLSLNAYRGCEHGCIYCFARPTHEYLGLSLGLDFETKIFVKQKAPALLAEELAKPKYQPQVIVVSSVTDCYQPIERKLEITRQSLMVLLDFRNPVSLITKNRLITRDLDLFVEMNRYQGVQVNVSLTTLDPQVARVMEPRASSPEHRLAAIEELARAGIPVNVLIAPIIPGLTDHEMPMILKRSFEAGASSAGYIVLRLPYAVKDLFIQWLNDHFPHKVNKVLNRIRSLRAGKLYDASWGQRMSGQGIFADEYRRLFEVTYRKIGYKTNTQTLSTSAFRNPHNRQYTFF